MCFLENTTGMILYVKVDVLIVSSFGVIPWSLNLDRTIRDVLYQSE